MVNYTAWILVIGSILLVAIAIWILLRTIKKNKLKKQLYEAKKLELFNEVEKEFIEVEQMRKDFPEMHPQEILWQLARRHTILNNQKGGIQNGREINNRTGTGDLQGTRSPEGNIGTMQQPSPSEPSNLNGAGENQTRDKYDSGMARQSKRRI